MFSVADLVGSLRLEPVGPDRYRAPSLDPGHGVVTGGQLLAQSIAAAHAGSSREEASGAGASGKAAKTLHTVFARGATPSEPLDVVVDRMHEGRAFASCTVSFRQGDRLCARSSVLLSADEPDLIRHADPAPASVAPGPGAPDRDAGAEPPRWETRIVGDVDVADPSRVGPPELDVWTRFPGAPDETVVNQALLAFASDFFLIGTAMRPHEGVGQSQAHRSLATGVVSQTVTFHEPFAAAGWLLMAHRSPYAGRGRGYGRADVFDAAGTYVASFVQDAMIKAMPGRDGDSRQ